MGTFANGEDPDEMLQSVDNNKKTCNILNSMQNIIFYDNTPPLACIKTFVDGDQVKT